MTTELKLQIARKAIASAVKTLDNRQWCDAWEYEDEIDEVVLDLKKVLDFVLVPEAPQ